MWMIELATKTITDESKIGSQSADSSVMTISCVDLPAWQG
jgi:hypothetical protein